VDGSAAAAVEEEEELPTTTTTSSDNENPKKRQKKNVGHIFPQQILPSRSVLMVDTRMSRYGRILESLPAVLPASS